MQFGSLLVVAMQPRVVYLILLCCVLVHLTVVGCDIIFHHTVNQDGALVYLACQGVAYLLYPLIGWLADVYFTRYRFVKFSFVIMIVSALLIATSASLCLVFPYAQAYFVLGGFSLFVTILGVGLFESTAIQFGMDQMLEASSDQISTFIHWYYWSINLGQLAIVFMVIGVLAYFSQCTIHLSMQHTSDPLKYLFPYHFTITCTAAIFMAGLQLVCACVGLCLVVCSKRHLNIDQTDQHPLKLIYKVLRYAWNHTCPENRSDFTNWENDIPPRIDLGKNKYGGPFTTEEVEDTKTFLRILLLLLSLLGFHLSGHGYSLLDQLMTRQCPSYWVFMIVTQPILFTILTVLVGVPVYQWIIVRCCQRYLPNMLKRMGLGLLCCLIKEVVEIIIQATATGSLCKHFDSVFLDSCYFFTAHVALNDTCTSVTELTDNQFFCDENNTPFLLLIIPNLLRGLSFLLVFMTALELICAQAPLQLKGLLIGLWYASLDLNYLVVEIPETFITDSITWEIFHEVKAFLIFLSLMLYLCVSKRYRYHHQDEVVIEQYLVEEIYERELDLTEEYEREMAAQLGDVVPSSMYGSISK